MKENMHTQAKGGENTPNDAMGPLTEHHFFFSAVQNLAFKEI